MKFDDSLLDAEKQTEFINALSKTRWDYFPFLILFITLLLLLAHFEVVNEGFVIGITIVKIIYFVSSAKDFRYVYYYEIEDETITFFLLNLLGKKASVLFTLEDLRKFKLSKEGKTITIPHIGNKQLIIVGDLAFKEVIPIISKIKNKTV